MDTCQQHSGICANVTNLENRIEQVQTNTDKSFELLRADMKIMGDKFDRFQNWIYGLLATSFVTIVVSVVTRFIK